MAKEIKEDSLQLQRKVHAKRLAMSKKLPDLVFRVHTLLGNKRYPGGVVPRGTARKVGHLLYRINYDLELDLKAMLDLEALHKSLVEQVEAAEAHVEAQKGS